MIQVSGQDVPIEGLDECPSQGSFLGPAPHAGEHTCVVLSDDRESVAVRVFLPTGSVIEEWKILRENVESANGRVYQRTRLKRPNGSPVIPATD